MSEHDVKEPWHGGETMRCEDPAQDEESTVHPMLLACIWLAGAAVLFAISHGILYVQDVPSLLWLGSLVNISLSVFKVGLAQLTVHRRALMADAVHGLGDTVAEVVTALAYQEAARPPDIEHPWGHGKIESLGAIVVTFILLYIAATMGWDTALTLYQMAQQKLRPVGDDGEKCHTSTSEPSHGADIVSNVGIYRNRLVRHAIIAVTVSSVILKEALFHATLYVGETSQSKLAVATAWHHRSDALAAGVALISQVGIAFGQNYVDSLGGGVVAAMLAHSACSSLQESLNDLLDYNPASEKDSEVRCGQEELSKSIVAVQGIRNHSLRTRRMGPYCLVDVTINVDARISASAASMLAESVHNRIIDDFKPFVTDVLVHVDPENSPQFHDLRTHVEASTTHSFETRTIGPDVIETRVRNAIFSLAEVRPDLPRIEEITELQTYYYTEEMPSNESNSSLPAPHFASSGNVSDTLDNASGNIIIKSFVDVKVDIRVPTYVTSLRDVRIVARAVRNRVLAEMPPGLVREVDVDLEIDDEGDDEVEIVGHAPSEGSCTGRPAQKTVLKSGAKFTQKKAAVRSTRRTTQRRHLATKRPTLFDMGHHSPPPAWPMRPPPPPPPVCPLVESRDGLRHGSWSSELCTVWAKPASTSRMISSSPTKTPIAVIASSFPSSTLTSTTAFKSPSPSSSRERPEERHLQQVTLVWDRGTESRQARFPTMRFESLRHKHLRATRAGSDDTVAATGQVPWLGRLRDTSRWGGVDAQSAKEELEDPIPTTNTLPEWPAGSQWPHAATD